MDRVEKRTQLAEVDRKLRFQTRLFMGIFAVMTILTVTHLYRDDVSPLWALCGFVPGLAIGYVLTRKSVV